MQGASGSSELHYVSQTASHGADCIIWGQCPEPILWRYRWFPDLWTGKATSGTPKGLSGRTRSRVLGGTRQPFTYRATAAYQAANSVTVVERYTSEVGYGTDRSPIDVNIILSYAVP